MKNKRHEKILELIEEYEIDTQETMIEKLRAAGFSVTQTTVSRDIRELGLVKGTTGRGTYKYTLPEGAKEEKRPVLSSSISEGVTDITAAGNMVVIRTHSGMANAVAVYVDAFKMKEILGCVAGDDTILIVVASVEIAEYTAEKMKEIFGIRRTKNI